MIIINQAYSLLTNIYSNQVGTGLFLFLLLMGLGSHRLYIRKVYEMVVQTSNGSQISKKGLLDNMFKPQGSTFSATIISAWILVFVAFAYYYFLTSHFFPSYNYFRVESLASSPLGFLFFGIMVSIPSGLVSAFLPKAYCYYEISREMKILMMSTIPVLMTSIFISAYQGTIFPHYNLELRSVAFLALILSQVVLLWPIYKGAWEVTR